MELWTRTQLFIAMQICLCAGKRTRCSMLTRYGVSAYQIRGQSKYSADGITFCDYTNIPYARAQHRFERAHLKPLQEIANKSLGNTARKCIQNDQNSISGQENCLFLNIHLMWTGNEAGKPKPVVVYLHGGTFNTGSPQDDIHDLSAFLQKGIIFVTVNYRLGLFGFASTPDQTIEPNLGLLDQRVALQWIQEYIRYFNGDRKRITLAGWSAGAAAVSYHLYSDHSKNLFSQALMASGSFLNPWAFRQQTDKCTLALCGKIGVRNCTKSVLKKLSVEKLLPWYSEELNFHHFGVLFSCFLPSMGTGTNLIPSKPLKLIKNRPKIDVPILMGFTSLEETCDVESDGEFSMRNYDPPLNHADFVNLFENIIELLQKNRSRQNISSMRRMADMLYGVMKFADLYSMHAESPLFLYRFDTTLKTSHLCAINEKGALHGDDIKLIFGKHVSERKKRIAKLRSDLIELWTNFFKFGDPNPISTNVNTTIQWSPYDTVNRTILQIDQKLSIRSMKISWFYRIWDKFVNCVNFGECSDVFSELERVSKN